MSDNNTILASAVAGGHLHIWDKVVAERLDSIDLTPLMVYLVDVVPADVLPHLAEQLDVLGFKGWLLATNEEERRLVVKNAIERKKYSGTPWAVKEALKSVGYNEAEIVEGVNAIYDGTFMYNGMITYGSNHWALFAVENLDLGESKGFSAEDLDLLKKLINEYKRAITHLVNISFSANVADEQLMKGIFSIQILDIDEEIVEEYTGENLIVNLGRSALARLLAGEVTERSIDRIGFGTNGVSPSSADTALTASFEKALDSFTYPDAQSVRFAFDLDFDEANGMSIREFGLICEDDSLFARKTRDAIVKTDQLKIVGSWTIIFE
jgi:hypothetical protein